MANDQQSQAAAQAKQDKSVFFFGVVGVVDELGVLIGEDRSMGRTFDDATTFAIGAALERERPWLDAPERRPLQA